MARTCIACQHPQRAEIDAALLAHRESYLAIAGHFGLAKSSLQRHEAHHLGETLRSSREARTLMDAASLVAEMNRLHRHAWHVLRRAEDSGDDRLALAAIREARGDVETLAKLGPLGDIERRLLALEQGGKDGHDNADDANDHQSD